jgi:hypothetical protein
MRLKAKIQFLITANSPQLKLKFMYFDKVLSEPLAKH